MITSPKIEELAFKGVCRWHVFNTGYASAYTLEVPNGGFILLRQIIFHPFYQGATRNAQLLNVAHQLSLVEQGSKTELVYQFRNPISQITDVNGIGNVHNVASTEATILETWGIFKQNVCVDLLNIPDVGTGLYGAVIPFQTNAQERPLPLGYGATAIIPTFSIGGAGAEQYFPAGQTRQFVGINFGGAGVRDNLRYDYTAGRQIVPATAGDIDRQYQFPLMSFGCWIFNIPVSEYLNY